MAEAAITDPVVLVYVWLPAGAEMLILFGVMFTLLIVKFLIKFTPFIG